MRNNITGIKNLLAALLLGSFANGVCAAAGDVDATFNVGTGPSSSASSAAIQADGKIIIGGSFSSVAGTSRNRIARLNADGTLDASFNPGTGVNGGSIFALALQTDGKIIIAGSMYAYNGTSKKNIARLNADGTLDASFNTSSGPDDLIRTVALQPDGKIIIGGQFYNVDGVARNKIARLNANGSLDVSFNPGTGTGYPSVGDWAADVHTSVLQPDGKVVIGGYFTSVNGIPRVRVARLNTDGSLDTGFYVGSGATTDVRAMAMQADGKILIGGDFDTYNGISRNKIARLNADGSLDTSFSIGSGFNSSVLAILPQADGKTIVVGGFNSFNGTGRNRIARLNANGSLDTGFNPGTGTNNTIWSGAIQSNGKVIIGGDFTTYKGVTKNRLTRVSSGDTDADGAEDAADNCTNISNANQLDTDSDLLGDVCDPAPNDADTDHDTVSNTTDNCLYHSNLSQLDSDIDGQGDACDGDDDNDSWADNNETACGTNSLNNTSIPVDTDSDLACNVVDNCPTNTNMNQVNHDFDSAGDVCDADDDNDGWTDADETTCGSDVFNSSLTPRDTDSDLICNVMDSDDDGDGLSDVDETSIYFTNPLRKDSDGDTLPDGWELSHSRNPIIADYAVSAGGGHTCALDDSGVHCWGVSDFGVTTVPSLVNPVLVSSGGTHSCALDDTGVHCWGDNMEGQTTVPPLSNPVMVSAGWSHSCALDNGEVKCWGGNFYGQTTIPELVNPSMVSAGGYHTCALDSSGVHCWGDNTYGKTAVPPLENPVSVISGQQHSCALDDTGLHCWGYNNYGQTDVPVLTYPVTMSAGNLHTCALDDTGVHCWGNDYSNQTAVPALVNPAAVSAGGNHTCALDNRGVHCWGDNTYGQITVPPLVMDPDGDGVNNNKDLFPLDETQSGVDTDGDAIDNVVDPDDDNDGSLDGDDNCSLLSNPDQLNSDGDSQGNVCDIDDDNDGLLEIANILDAGSYHSCALDSNGVHCWGSDPGATTVPALSNPVAVSAGDSHSCAIDDSGVVCWGSDSSGQINVPSLFNPVAVSAGWKHSCAIDASGVHCWGNNTYGQLNVPALVNPTVLSAGYNHNCVIDDTGVVCWGDNGDGQASPPALSNPTMVSAGLSHTCALDDTGVHCWGDNTFGQTTVPSLVNPVAVSAYTSNTCTLDDSGANCWGVNYDGQLVPALVNPTAISTGSMHACALDATGIVCWGYGGYGQLTNIPSLVIPDNCPVNANPDQLDTDFDGEGNACDTDDDNDGVLDINDPAPLDKTITGIDTDGDSIDNAVDTDDDGDSMPDVWEVRYGFNPLLNDASADADSDGLSNAQEYAANTAPLRSDTDRDTMTDGAEVSLGRNPLRADYQVSAGELHTCVLGDTGVACWGGNPNGQTTVPTLVNPSVLSAGDFHNCALNNTGVVCWGFNSEGQTDVPSLANPIMVTAGGHASCAIDNTGLVCWGSYAPIPALQNPRAVSVGWDHICALDDTGVHCWGSNTYGQTTVPALVNPVMVSGSGYHSCALDDNGVHCWGYNNVGQTNVPTLLNPVFITAGGYSSCAIDDSGVVCWGANGDVTIPALVNPVAVSTHISHTCALDETGVVCWGDDTNGQSTLPTLSFDWDLDDMPDAWEQQHGLDRLNASDATSDADNDGYSNWEEYNAGTDPQDTQSHPFVSVKNDFNNNGIADWYWKGDAGSVTTKNEIWQLTFPLQSSAWGVPSRFYPPNFVDQPNWEIVTTGDFNKDGDADVLWRNKTSAQWRVWQIQNGQRVAQNNLADFDLAHAWTVIGAGDTDKDGDDDVILNNTTTGEIIIWAMQDHALATTHSVGTKAGYAVNRIGDFNKDGDVDLLLREIGTDVLVNWELQANAYVAERSLGTTGTGFSPACAGDFDGDGDEDIMLLNSSTTQEKWFVIENYARTGQRFGSTNVGFVFYACGDYDGDGDMDTLWRREAGNTTRVVLQQDVFGTPAKQTVYTNPYGSPNPGEDGYGFVYRGNSN